MANTQWLDKSHPQTLLSANMLLYFFAGLWILEVLLGVGIPFFGLLAIPAIFAGLGIANEKKLGYWGGVAVAGDRCPVLARVFHRSDQHDHQPDFRGCPGCPVAAPDEPELRAHLVQADEGTRPEAPALAGNQLAQPATGSLCRKQRVHELAGVEGHEVLWPFAQPYQLDGDAQFARDRDGDPALGRPVQLGQDDPGDRDRFGERPRLNEPVLPCGRIEHQQHLGDRGRTAGRPPGGPS